MPSKPTTGDNEWSEIWDAREAALTTILGEPSNMVFHALVPFYLGGFADVLAFPNYVPGTTYVTAEMTGEELGQRPSSLGHYELMVCVQHEESKAADLV